MNENDKKPSSGRSSQIGYRIEVRDTNFSTINPRMLCDGIVGPNWRVFTPVIDNNPAGIPDDGFSTIARKSDHNLLTYEGAVALAWTLIAQHPHSIGLECRLVQYKLEAQYTLYESGIVDGLTMKNQWQEKKTVSPRNPAPTENTNSLEQSGEPAQ